MTSDNVHTPVRYPSDLSDEEWAIIEQVLNELDPYKTGRRRDSNLREILNAHRCSGYFFLNFMQL
jgi:putative transposase